MDPDQAARCGFRNVTRDASFKPSEPSKEETVDPSSSSPQVKFVWSNEAMMRMFEAVTKRHLNPQHQHPQFTHCNLTMLPAKKPVLLLTSLVFFATTAFIVHAAPAGQGQGRRLGPVINYVDYTVTPPGNLTSNWHYEVRFLYGGQDRREQMRQQRQLAFREFSEKYVSNDCIPILTSTLVHLDNVRGFVHDRFKTKASFELLEPILQPLVEVLDMHKNRTFPMRFVPKVDIDASSAQFKLRRIDEGLDDYDYSEIIQEAAWTEENKPELLFKYRFRYLEKNLGVFQHVLKVAPEPVRQELEASGFAQETRVLRQHARSLLTCEGVPHVTVAVLEEKLGEEESDSYVDRDTARDATVRFYHVYHRRVILASMRIPMSMDPDQAARCGFRNVTKDASSKPSEPSKEETVDPSSSSPQVKFVWSNEAMSRMAEAVIKNHRTNPELASMLYQD
ncbi:hypothetical protein K457DRAFT_20681 [Linnemannia elongata AG-77]|uniref:Uncharacterized protein n=1 Tax=Linnemannia elongata AG-77 TaxID=1314771 RepID=A0A197JST6_9FUNG|nr:hypothetical protein K457DRAFT_20681 [Linnemannia elongata AG-77]